MLCLGVRGRRDRWRCSLLYYRESPVSAPPLRRTDKLMSHERTLELLVRGFCGRIATVGADGLALLRAAAALSAALRRVPPPGTCGRLSVAPQDRGRNICPARHPSARSPHATMGRKSRERRCVMAVAPLPHMSGQTHTSSESKSGTDLLKTSSVTLTSVHLLSCAV